MIAAVLESTEHLSDTIRTFTFRPQRPIKYVAGQFTELYLPHKADARGQRRWFTFSSSPSEDLLTITTKISSPGSSFKQALLRLQPGDSIQLAEPMGDFILPKDKRRPLLFVAGGIGITPFRSMLKYLHDTNQERNISLLYAAQTEEDLIFTDIISSQTKNHQLIVSKPSNKWTGLSGHITIQRIQAAADLSTAMIYISGPEPMVEHFFHQLQILNIPKPRLIMDYFPGYQAI